MSPLEDLLGSSGAPHGTFLGRAAPSMAVSTGAEGPHDVPKSSHARAASRNLMLDPLEGPLEALLWALGLWGALWDRLGGDPEGRKKGPPRWPQVK